MRLDGKLALVTGAQKGIGRAIAVALARDGAHVLANYFDDAPAAARLCEEIESSGAGRCTPVQGDVAAPASVEHMFAQAAEEGGVDVLVNNAGIFPRVDFLAMTEADWDRVHEVNLKGSFRCCQAAARQMRDHGRGGSIVNLTSGAAFRSSPRGVHYVASKAGVLGLTRAVAVELAPLGIRVNAVAPGLTDTDQPRDGMTEAEIAAAGEQVPLGRISTPQDIASVVAFLVSDAAGQVTGQTVHVNGGQYLT